MEKSRIFINGLLDKIFKHLKQTEKIKKPGGVSSAKWNPYPRLMTSLWNETEINYNSNTSTNELFSTCHFNDTTPTGTKTMDNIHTSDSGYGRFLFFPDTASDEKAEGPEKLQGIPEKG
jgi:hypothetical protein